MTQTASPMNHRQQRGVTLVEMLVAIAVLAILAAMAAPSYRSFIIDTRMTTQANDFLTMLVFSRSEAIKRNTRVTMCKSSDGATCAASGGWQQGWIVFVDGSSAGSKDGTDEVLRVHGALSDSSVMTDNLAVDYISYVSNGQSRDAGGGNLGGTIKLCSNDATRKGRNIVITTSTGRARVDTTYPDCS